MSADPPVDVAATGKKKRPILLSIVIVILVAIGAFSGIVALQPDSYQVTRSTVVAAPADAIFGEVNDFHRWEAWSPWAKLDPEASNSFAGPDAGTGAQFAWSGNDKVGEGSMTILDSRPYEHIQIKLDFKKPTEDTSTIDFAFEPAGDGTKITWTMSGRHQNFIGKAFCFVMNMDKMVGGDFEKGLTNLKRVVESKS